MTLSAQQLAAQQRRSTGAADVYVCPADHRTILRDVRLMSRSASVQTLELWIDRAGASFYWVYDTAFPAYGRYTLVDAFIVLDAGDKLRANTNDGYGFDIWVSGHEFSV